MLELLGAPQSVFVRATRMACIEKGVAYQLIPARPHSAAVLAISPFGRIPVMRHDSFELFESLAIIGYIDAAFEGPPLLPEEPRARARIMQWASAITTGVFPAVVGYMQAHAFPTGPDGQPSRAVVESQLPAVLQHMRLLDRALAGGSHLAGAAFSIADMYLLPMLAYLSTFPESSQALLGADSLHRYFATHRLRESFVASEPPPLAAMGK